ncbi:mmpL11, partial [Symbiodinium sp. CCMP2456]
VGVYIEFCADDTSNAKQGIALCRVDNLEEKSVQGQWCEVSLLAASDEHLLWWLDHGAGRDDNWQCQLHVCKGSDKFWHIPSGDLADKKIEWIKEGKCRKYVEEEVARLDPALCGLRNLERELALPKKGQRKLAQDGRHEGEAGPPKRESQKDRVAKKKKRQKEDPGHGRARSAPSAGGSRGRWFGEPVDDDPKDRSLTDTSCMGSSSNSSGQKRKRSPRPTVPRTGPFGSSTQIDYGRAFEVSSGSFPTRRQQTPWPRDSNSRKATPRGTGLSTSNSFPEGLALPPERDEAVETVGRRTSDAETPKRQRPGIQ